MQFLRAREAPGWGQTQAVAAHFDRETTTPFGRELLRRLAMEDALAAHWQLPDFAAWQARQAWG